MVRRAPETTTPPVDVPVLNGPETPDRGTLQDKHRKGNRSSQGLGEAHDMHRYLGPFSFFTLFSVIVIHVAGLFFFVVSGVPSC